MAIEDLLVKDPDNLLSDKLSELLMISMIKLGEPLLYR